MKQVNQGFTLIEVIVALFVLSFAMVAIMQLLKSTSTAMVVLKQYQVAQWVGSNYLVQAQIETKFPKLGTSSSVTKMANSTWYVDAEVVGTPDKNIRKILVQVFDRKESKKAIFSANGYRSRLVQW